MSDFDKTIGVDYSLKFNSLSALKAHQQRVFNRTVLKSFDKAQSLRAISWYNAYQAHQSANNQHLLNDC